VSAVALDALIDAQRALIDALDHGDPSSIESRTTEYATCVARVRAAGAWHAAPELRARVDEARALADAARTRVNVLADRTRQRLALLTGMQGRPARIGYGRNGRLR